MADLEAIRAIAERVTTSEGLTLVDIELKGGRSNPLLRITIDREGGVSHGDCQNVSEQVSAILDIEDRFPSSYMLEVSSPGLDRKLTKESDYAHFKGRKARISLREPVDGRTMIEGRLAGVESGRLQVEVDDGRTAVIELSNITKARLIVEF